MADHKIRQLSEEDLDSFFEEENSAYIKCTYYPDIQSFKVSMYHNIEDLDEDSTKMLIMTRGLAELAIIAPSDVYEVGYNARNRDFVDLDEDLSDDEKDLLNNPVGRA
jgi:hypothetical protein